MRNWVLCGLAAVLIANDNPPAPANDEAGSPETVQDAQTGQHASPFVGRYNGNSFETAMGMEVLADGTWGWGVSVGALDLRARGTWEEKNGILHLTSTPKPIAPVFTWSGLESADPDTEAPPAQAPFVKVVWSESGEPFRYGSAELICANGKTFYGQVRNDGYPSAQDQQMTILPPPERDPRQSCNTPETIVLKLSTHSVRSEPFNFVKLGWEPGKTLLFEFRRNDMGVTDFTGVRGHLENEKLILTGAEWPLELRKMPPPETRGSED